MLLTNLKMYVENLRRLGAVPASAFLSDPDKVASAKYHFIVAIECDAGAPPAHHDERAKADRQRQRRQRLHLAVEQLMQHAHQTERADGSNAQPQTA